MKSRLLLFSLVSSLPLTAADFQWDVNGNAAGLGGTGTWNTTNTFWDATATGVNDGTDTTTAYTFTTADKAIFGGTGGAVSVGNNVDLNKLSVDTSGYSFTGSRITFGGTGATLTANSDFTIANQIRGNFTKDGMGAVTITGQIGFNTVTLTDGTLTRQASIDNDTSASIVNGGLLILASTTANSTSSVTLNTGTVRQDGTNDAQIWNGNGAGGGFVTLNGGTFEQNGKNETVGGLILNGGSITGAGTLTSNSVIDARSGSSATILAGTLGLTKTTAGTVTLTAANTYTGTTTISGGTLLVGNGGSTGRLGGGALVNNGTLTNTIVGGNITLGGTGNVTGLTGSGSSSFSANSINFATVTGGAFSANTTGSQSYVTNSNNGGLVFTNGASTYNFTTSGGASITMRGDIGANSAPASGGAIINLDTSAGNGVINLDISVGRSNQFWNIGAINANAGTGAINWTGTYGEARSSNSSQTTPITLTGAINMTANFQSQTLQTLTLNATGSSTVTGNLLGTINLVKGGSQTLTLSGANTFTGNVLVSNGELQSSATNNVRSLGADTVGRTVTVSSPATLKFLGSDTFGNAGSTPNPSLIISGTVTNVAGKFNALGNVTLSGGQLTNQGGFAGSYQSYSLAGSVTVNGTSASSITTTGTTNTGVHLGTNTSFNVADATSSASDLTVSAPLINRNGDLGGAGGLTKSGAGTMTLSAVNTYTGNTTVSAGTLEVSGSGQLASGTYAGDISNAGTLNINTSANQTLSGAITGAGSLVKNNSGTLTISGNSSTYTGTTTVSAGTLLVSGQLGGDTSVSSTATVGGGGTVGGNLSFLTGSLLDISSALTGNSLSVGGTVTFGSNFGIDDLAGVTWGSVANGIYTLIDTTGTDFSLAGLDNFGPSNFYNLGGGRSAYFTQGSLQLVVIPEPGAALLGGLGMLTLLRRRRN